MEVRPKLVGELVGVSRHQVYKVKARLKSRLKYQRKRETEQYRQRNVELLDRMKSAIEVMGLPQVTSTRLSGAI